jgi:hypothetical protein
MPPTMSLLAVAAPLATIISATRAWATEALALLGKAVPMAANCFVTTLVLAPIVLTVNAAHLASFAATRPTLSAEFAPRCS